MILDSSHWYNAYIAIGLVSLLPNALLIIIPYDWLNGKSRTGLDIQSMMLCFAAAGLLGDVFLHTLPHLLTEHEGHDHVHNHNSHIHSHGDNQGLTGNSLNAHHEVNEGPLRTELLSEDGGNGATNAGFDLYTFIGIERTMVVPLMVLLGFLIFLLGEKVATAFLPDHEYSHVHSHEPRGGRNNHYDTDSGATRNSEKVSQPRCDSDSKGYNLRSNASIDTTPITTGSRKRSTRSSCKSSSTKSSTSSDTSITAHNDNQTHNTIPATIQGKSEKPTNDEDSLLVGVSEAGLVIRPGVLLSGGGACGAFAGISLSAPGWLNLIADSMHNFTDGIAIGASFASGQGLARATFLSIIFHELPHEIGDFTILIQNGLT